MTNFLKLLNVLMILTLFCIELSGCSASSNATAPRITEPEHEVGDMVLVSSGEFRMGSQPFIFDADESPLHTVTLSAYYINVFEVTNAEYATFLSDTSGGTYHYWFEMDITQTADGFVAKPGLENYPVRFANHDNATAYAAYLNGRLPTEAEWEKAARGPGNERHFPWGSQIYAGQANWDNPEGLWEVGTATGKSYYGCSDMAGNVWEWTADWYDASYYRYTNNTNPQGPISGEFKSVRGGGYLNNSELQMRCSERQAVDPGGRYVDLGFRCVVDSAVYVNNRLGN
ncbi:MAG: SUMF1/EgtB/PvdO family nonheme iron enzyme [Calditrichaeota bacterium]|nr:SUMF1/EgtB/PvdO family nonheme iron enzyme [Calditrichota bacterium]MBT7790687.1 SUMF1/EgtB/PvdO family nonheme iron enzyme [Calditrichota bacterium]